LCSCGEQAVGPSPGRRHQHEVGGERQRARGPRDGNDLVPPLASGWPLRVTSSTRAENPGSSSSNDLQNAYASATRSSRDIGFDRYPRGCRCYVIDAMNSPIQVVVSQWVGKVRTDWFSPALFSPNCAGPCLPWSTTSCGCRHSLPANGISAFRLAPRPTREPSRSA
jgi:hypothetical protein